MEHYVAAWVEALPANALHMALAQSDPSDAALLDLTPGVVQQNAWAIPWSAGRWIAVMIAGAWFSRRLAASGTPRWVRLSAVTFASLAAGAAEKLVIPWPAMPYEWVVVMRPWVRQILIWDLDFIRFYAGYALAGWLWARLVAERFCGRDSGDCPSLISPRPGPQP